MCSSTLSLTSACMNSVQVPVKQTEITSYFNNIQIVFSNKLWHSCVIIIGMVTDFVNLAGELEEDISIRNMSGKYFLYTKNNLKCRRLRVVI